MQVYQVIEQLRKEKGITKLHIANSFGKSAAWYSDVSKGFIRVKADDLPIFATILGVDVSYFFDTLVSETHNKSTA